MNVHTAEVTVGGVAPGSLPEGGPEFGGRPPGATSSTAPGGSAFLGAAARRFEPVTPKGAARWLDDPVGFATAAIDGLDLTAYQRAILAAVPERGRVAVRGPHGLGKTTVNAVAVLWFALSREAAGVDWKVATTAGAWRQLERYLWPEVRKWAGRLRWDVLDREPFTARELLDLALKLRHGQAFAVASDDAALIEGVHADHVLYVFDESKSIVPAVFDAAEGAFSGAGRDSSLQAFALATSTPGEPSGRFYDIHARKPGLEDWWARHVTVDEAIAAGRITDEWVAARRRQWGADSAVFANRVLGEFHTSDSDSVIPLGWVELANDRWRAWQEAGGRLASEPLVCGADVAREGSDQTVLALRFGDVLTELRRYSRQATTETTGRVTGVLSAHPGMRAVVDVIGVGGGVVDQLRELRKPVTAFNASNSYSGRDRSGELGFLNMRSAAWWRLRELLDPGFDPTIALPPDDQLTGDLTAGHWKVTAAGKIQIESKDEIRKRIGRSTDAADAVVMAFWSYMGQGEVFMAYWASERSAFGARRCPGEHHYWDIDRIRCVNCGADHQKFLEAERAST